MAAVQDCAKIVWLMVNNNEKKRKEYYKRPYSEFSIEYCTV